MAKTRGNFVIWFVKMYRHNERNRQRYLTKKYDRICQISLAEPETTSTKKLISADFTVTKAKTLESLVPSPSFEADTCSPLTTLDSQATCSSFKEITGYLGLFSGSPLRPFQGC